LWRSFWRPTLPSLCSPALPPLRSHDRHSEAHDAHRHYDQSPEHKPSDDSSERQENEFSGEYLYIIF
jgi:hypothetical protein